MYRQSSAERRSCSDLGLCVVSEAEGREGMRWEHATVNVSVPVVYTSPNQSLLLSHLDTANNPLTLHSPPALHTSQAPSQGLSAALNSSDPTKMTFGFFDEYFATDPAAAGATASAGQVAVQRIEASREPPAQQASSSQAAEGRDVQHPAVLRTVDQQSLIPPRSLGSEVASDDIVAEPEVKGM